MILSRPLARSAACRPLFAALLLTGAAAIAAEPAAAQLQEPVTIDTSEVAIANNNDLVIELGAGGRVRPRYLGADDYIVTPFPIISVDYLSIPGLFTVGGSDRTGGLRFGPSFGFTGSRDSGDDADLFGTRDLDETYEVGVRVGYEYAIDAVYGLEFYGEARGAFGEASGVVGGFGVDAIARPTEALELKFGPRATLASSDYMSTYFSISQAESAASGGRLDTFDADGGFTTVGVDGSVRYEFRPNWFARADASYERLVADAADSPIARVGSRDQFTFGLGLSRRFSFDLF